MYVVLENERCPIAVCVVSGVNLRAHSLSHTHTVLLFLHARSTHTLHFTLVLSLSLGYCLFVNINEQSIAVVRLVVVVVADFI